MIETPPPASAPVPPPSRTPARTPRMTRGQANLVRAFCLWTVWVWGTRIGNIWGDDARTTGFKVVHTVLAAVSIAFAVAVWFVVRRLRRPVSTPLADPAGDAG